MKRAVPRLNPPLLLLLLLIATPAWAQPPGPDPAAPPLPSVALPPELARVLTDYEAAWSAKDASALARLFAEDGFVLPNNGLPVRGRKAVEAFYTGHGGPLFLRAFAYAVDGRVGYILGGYTGKAGSPDDGKFTLTLRQGENGRWLIVSDMDSSNRRPSGPAPEAAEEAFLVTPPGPRGAIGFALLQQGAVRRSGRGCAVAK